MINKNLLYAQPRRVSFEPLTVHSFDDLVKAIKDGYRPRTGNSIRDEVIVKLLNH